MIDLDALANAASCLDPLPTSVTRLAAMVCGDVTPDLVDVIDVVTYDQALTATLLRAANSSWSASRVAITTVRDAVVRLGAAAVFSTALGVGVRGRLVSAIPEYGLAEGELWRHSVAASLAAELIVRVSPMQLPMETVTAALLHDVGKLVMCRFLSSELLALLDASRADGGRTRMEAESAVLGVHHAELGGLILQCWSLPERLVRAVAYHHRPEHGLDIACYGVHLADVVAKIATGVTDDNADAELVEATLFALRLGADAVDEIVAATGSRLEEVLARYRG